MVKRAFRDEDLEFYANDSLVLVDKNYFLRLNDLLLQTPKMYGYAHFIENKIFCWNSIF